MRLWSIHPKYLDGKGLGATWAEGIQGMKIITEGKQRHRYHPQWKRFKYHETPLDAIQYYLYHIYIESQQRGYNYDFSKIDGKNINPEAIEKIVLPMGQYKHEINHLLAKLHERDMDKWKILASELTPTIHPFFVIDPNDTSTPWEKKQ